MRRVTLVLAGMALALVLASGVALAEMKIGTDGPDTIVGTNSNDHITGMGGDDTLQGKAGDDIYHFADSFGQDTLTETAFVNVGGTRLPGGTDTLNFSGYTPAPSNSPGSLLIRMIPQSGGRRLQ